MSGFLFLIPAKEKPKILHLKTLLKRIAILVIQDHSMDLFNKIACHLQGSHGTPLMSATFKVSPVMPMYCTTRACKQCILNIPTISVATSQIDIEEGVKCLTFGFPSAVEPISLN